MDTNDIASTHLGKTADGKITAPYITPQTIEPHLLVPVPRELNRKGYGITPDIFKGLDVWHCYEFSTLIESGMPLVGVLKIVYPSHSPNIVESKSLKLYLNSFNMVKMGVDYQTAIKSVAKQISEDLTHIIGSTVNVGFFQQGTTVFPTDFFTDHFELLERVVSPTTTFDQYKEDPSIFNVGDTSQEVVLSWRSELLRSNCRVTNQPDWGDVFIKIEGNTIVTRESMLKYLVSMRSENHFHEEVCELIYKRLHDLLNPKKLMVACLYTRRGGIDINPIRSSTMDTVCNTFQNPYLLTTRTIRQ